MQHLKDGALVLAVEVSQAETSRVKTLMQDAGALQVTRATSTALLETATRQTSAAMQNTGESALEAIENIWGNLKDTVQKLVK